MGTAHSNPRPIQEPKKLLSTDMKQIPPPEKSRKIRDDGKSDGFFAHDGQKVSCTQWMDFARQEQDGTDNGCERTWQGVIRWYNPLWLSVYKFS